MTAEILPDHLQRPHVRPLQPIPTQGKDGKTLLALRDPLMLRPQTMVVAPQVLQLLAQCQGKLTLDEIAERLKAPKEQLAELLKGMDQFGLLWGPTFKQLEQEKWQQLKKAGAFPVRSSGLLGRTPEGCAEQIEKWFGATEDPELEETPIGLVAPHLDYARGWPNYAGAYYALHAKAKQGHPVKVDRVVVLGTNHFGIGDGVILTELGFTTPLGVMKPDTKVLEGLRRRLGSADAFADQIDHLAEHSIELQLPWIQHCFGDVPIVAALVPDPTTDQIESDGARATGAQFVEALKETLAETGGTTFFVASSDMSHVGPQFGEPRPIDDQRRIDVERHDRAMMSKYLSLDADAFVEEMSRNRNPTRWCSVGNMTALLQLTGERADSIELIDYRQASDQRGLALVSSAAMVVVKE